MSVANDRIPHRAFAILLPAFMIETGVLRGPRVAIEAAGLWAWLSTLLAVGALALNVILLVTVMRRHGFPAYPDLLEELFGPVLGRTILALHGLAIVLRLARISRTSGELITLELLDQTPTWAVVLPGLVLVALLARQGVEPTARFAAILFPIYYPGIMLVLVLAHLRGDIAMLVDLTDFSATRVLRGAVELVPDVQGYTALLAFLPWAWRPERAGRPMLLGVGLVGALSVLLATSTASVLGPAARELTWPTLELIEAISAPNLLLERADVVFFSIWVLCILDLSALTLAAGSYMLASALGRHRNPRPAAFWVAGGAAVLALLPAGFLQLELVMANGFKVIPVAEHMLPGLLWAASLLRRGRQP